MGALTHAPKHSTSISVNMLSGVVCPQSMPTTTHSQLSCSPASKWSNCQNDGHVLPIRRTSARRRLWFVPRFFLMASKMTSLPTPPSIHGVVVQICTKYLPTGSLQHIVNDVATGHLYNENKTGSFYVSNSFPWKFLTSSELIVISSRRRNKYYAAMCFTAKPSFNDHLADD